MSVAAPGRGEAEAGASPAAAQLVLEATLEDARWAAADLAGHARAACAAALAHLGLPPESCEISLLGCSDARIAALNAAFRGRSAPTDVLSWPSEERGARQPGRMPSLPAPAAGGPPLFLGDIAIAWETCRRDAERMGREFPFHLRHLLVHATLHLLGFDHERSEDAALMERLEAEILANMGLPDPYAC